MAPSYTAGSATPLPQISETDPIDKKLEWFKGYFRPHFKKVILGPIHHLVHSDNALIGFILMACTIDYLAGYLWGGDTNRPVRRSYKEFIEKYLKKYGYSPNDLYDSLRNGLVHHFTIKKYKYELTQQQADYHLKDNGYGQQILNAENFEDDIVGATKEYFDEVENITADPTLLEKLVNRYMWGPLIDVDVNKMTRVTKLS